MRLLHLRGTRGGNERRREAIYAGTILDSSAVAGGYLAGAGRGVSHRRYPGRGVTADHGWNRFQLPAG